MTKATAYLRTAAENDAERQWEHVADPPYVVSLGDDDFLRVPKRPRLRAYVNGLPVVAGLQAIEDGDFVRIVRKRGPDVAFRFAGRSGAEAEPARGRRCAFTRKPIEGLAVRCAACGRVVCQKVAEQVGSCACGAPLRPDARPQTPAEELL